MMSACAHDVGYRLRRVFFPFACGYFFSFMLRNINAVAFPALVQEFGFGPEALGVLTSAYFLGFALFQLPLGLLLDRYGPRRVNSSLLVVAASGILIFASSANLLQLAAGRALMGVGFAGCLMSSMAAFVLWFSRLRMASLSGWMIAVGACGAIAGTAPAEIALRALSWRTLFFALAGLVLCASLAIRGWVPEKSIARQPEPWSAQIAGLLQIYAHRDFWRIGLLAAFSQASALSLLGLWSGPWLRDIGGLDIAAVGVSLAVVAASFGLGGIAFGTLSDRLARRGIVPERTYLAGCFAALLALVPLAAAFGAYPRLAWSVYIACGAAGVLAYPLLTARFPVAMTGRVLTGLNMLTMACSFLFQSGIGAIIGHWPVLDGRYAVEGYRSAFASLVLLQAIAFMWALGIARPASVPGASPRVPS